METDRREKGGKKKKERKKNVGEKWGGGERKSGETKGEKRGKMRATAGGKAGGGGKKRGQQREGREAREKTLLRCSTGGALAGARCDRGSGKGLSRVCSAGALPLPGTAG